MQGVERASHRGSEFLHDMGYARVGYALLLRGIVEEPPHLVGGRARQKAPDPTDEVRCGRRSNQLGDAMHPHGTRSSAATRVGCWATLVDARPGYGAFRLTPNVRANGARQLPVSWVSNSGKSLWRKPLRRHPLAAIMPAGGGSFRTQGIAGRAADLQLARSTHMKLAGTNRASGKDQMHKGNGLSADLANCMSATNDQGQEHEH